MRYIDALARPIVPNEKLREAVVALLAACPALWALGEAVIALGS